MWLLDSANVSIAPTLPLLEEVIEASKPVLSLHVELPKFINVVLAAPYE